jgi:hypothetical protein
VQQVNVELILCRIVRLAGGIQFLACKVGKVCSQGCVAVKMLFVMNDYWWLVFCFSVMLSCPGLYIGNNVFKKAQGLLKLILKSVKIFLIMFKIMGYTQPDCSSAAIVLY